MKKQGTVFECGWNPRYNVLIFVNYATDLRDSTWRYMFVCCLMTPGLSRDNSVSCMTILFFFACKSLE